jgi:hypothetical protein
MTRTDLLLHCQRLGLIPIPLKPCSKEPLLGWGNDWNPSIEELQHWAARAGINWGVRYGAEMAVLDFDSPKAFNTFRREQLKIALTKNLRYQVVQTYC